MSREERQQHARATTRRAILDAALALFVSDGYAQVSIRNIAAKVEYSPGAIYSYFPIQGRDLLRPCGGRLPSAWRDAAWRMRQSDDPLDDIRAAAWRFYEFSKVQPQYFALVFLDRRVPRIGREYEQFAFMSDLKSRLRAHMQRCIDEGVFPASVDADVGLRLLWAPILGIAALRLSERLPPRRRRQPRPRRDRHDDCRTAGWRAFPRTAVAAMQSARRNRDVVHATLRILESSHTMRGTIYVTLPFLIAAATGCGTGVKGESTTGGRRRAADRCQHGRRRRAADSTVSRSDRHAGGAGRS